MLAIFAACLIGTTFALPLDPNGRIVKGEDAAPDQFPYMLSLRNENSSHICGASLIHNKWAITAAHCVTGGYATNFSVVAGTIFLNETGVKSEVTRTIVHEKWDITIVINDIALLELATPLQESSSIRIIKLDHNSDDSVRNCTVTGWGTLEWGGRVNPNNLQFLRQKTVDLKDCRYMWGGRVYDSNICTYANWNKGVCNGDSGGPVVADQEQTLIGLVSWGAPCATGSPDVNTRVSSFVDWINENTGLDL